MPSLCMCAFFFLSLWGPQRTTARSCSDPTGFRTQYICLNKVAEPRKGKMQRETEWGGGGEQRAVLRKSERKAEWQKKVEDDDALPPHEGLMEDLLLAVRRREWEMSRGKASIRQSRRATAATLHRCICRHSRWTNWDSRRPHLDRHDCAYSHLLHMTGTETGTSDSPRVLFCVVVGGVISRTGRSWTGPSFQRRGEKMWAENVLSWYFVLIDLLCIYNQHIQK